MSAAKMVTYAVDWQIETNIPACVRYCCSLIISTHYCFLTRMLTRVFAATLVSVLASAPGVVGGLSPNLWFNYPPQATSGIVSYDNMTARDRTWGMRPKDNKTPTFTLEFFGRDLWLWGDVLLGDVQDGKGNPVAVDFNDGYDPPDNEITSTSDVSYGYFAQYSNLTDNTHVQPQFTPNPHITSLTLRAIVVNTGLVTQA